MEILKKFIINKSFIYSYFKFFAALPLALNIITKERATIINTMSSNRCKFIINEIHD